MSRSAKLLTAAKANPAGLTFAEAQALAVAAGFTLARVSGSHHLYKRAGTPEIINLQSKGGKAKAYQVRQILDVIDRYGLKLS